MSAGAVMQLVIYDYRSENIDYSDYFTNCENNMKRFNSPLFAPNK